MPFLTRECLRSDGSSSWVLLAPLTYRGHADTWTVPIGFTTDYASVPWWAQSLIPRTGTHQRAAVLHDYLCRRQGSSSAPVPRRDADGVFRRVLREAGVPLWRRWLMWAGVRADSRMSGATAKEWARFTVIAAVFLAAVGLVVLDLTAGLLALTHHLQGAA